MFRHTRRMGLRSHGGKARFLTGLSLVLSFVFFLLLLDILVVSNVSQAAGPAGGREREFTITARQFAYSPPRIRVRLGDRVTLRVTSEDVVHGLYIDGYGINAKVYPGQETVVSFVANRPGKIRYRCSVICGNLHPFMIGEVVVGPNYTLWGALALTVLAAGGTVLMLWRRGEEIRDRSEEATDGTA
ncbi:MAG: cupredoxin domain-containing protein [Armatimonadota bacterium]|nr:cupredoxin domain-containing protein [Armatimonadota bacterium]MDR5702256.1 cupredoxin domain-containing protein [Armatimonadota bacterium]